MVRQFHSALSKILSSSESSSDVTTAPTCTSTPKSHENESTTNVFNNLFREKIVNRYINKQTTKVTAFNNQNNISTNNNSTNLKSLKSLSPKYHPSASHTTSYSQQEQPDPSNQPSNVQSTASSSQTNEPSSQSCSPVHLSQHFNSSNSSTSSDDSSQFQIYHNMFPEQKIDQLRHKQPNFSPPSPIPSPEPVYRKSNQSNVSMSKQSSDDSSSSASYASPLSSYSDISVVESVQIIDDNLSDQSSQSTSLDQIPPHPSPEDSDSILSHLQSIINQLTSQSTSNASSKPSASSFSFKFQEASKIRSKRTAKHKRRKNKVPSHISLPPLNTHPLQPSFPPPSSTQESSNQFSLPRFETMDDYDLGDYVDCLSEAFSPPTIQSPSNQFIDAYDSLSPNSSITASDTSSEHIEIPSLDPEESQPVGNFAPKSPDSIRISSFNPNGLPPKKLAPQLQHCITENIDIQCFTEINQNMINHNHRKKFHDAVRSADSAAKDVWANTDLPMNSTYKPGGAGVVSFSSVSGRIKDKGIDRRGRWAFQVFDSGSDFCSVVFSIYRCCDASIKDSKKTSNHQQRILQAELGLKGNPLRYFKLDLITEIKRLKRKFGDNLRPYILGDFNNDRRIEQIISDICHEFDLVDIYSYLNPNTPDFKTYMRGSTRIDRGLIPKIVADKMKHHAEQNATTPTVYYESFFYRFCGDHRALVIDIPVNIMFGTWETSPFDSRRRGFTSKDIKAVPTYLEAFDKYAKQHNIYDRAAKLYASEEPNHSEAEKVDRDITRATQHAENKCRKLRRDYWSIPIHIIRRELVVWNSLKWRRKRNLDNTAVYTRAASIGIQISDSTSTLEIDSAIVTLRKKIRELHEKAVELRDQHLLNLLNLARELHDKERANMIKAIRKQERRHQGYGLLKYFRGKTVKSQAVNEIKIPSSWTERAENDASPLEDAKVLYSNTPNKNDISQDPNWTTIKTPSDILMYCKMRNQQHFGQAYSEKTPFTQEPLQTKFAWSGQTQEAKMVLEGTYTDDDLTHIQRMFLNHLQRVTPSDHFSETITYDDFRKKMRKWRESTSTSPSGRHLGHYKACVATLDRKLFPAERLRLQELQKSIANLYVTMINYSTKHKYSFDRWKTIVNMMIYKEAGNSFINRLRVIHIYEADLALLLGRKWKDSLNHATDNETLHPGQYGGVKGRDCTQLTFLEELRLDYSLLTRTPFGNFDNDARACYDRILVALSSLASQKFGVSPQVVMVHAKTLEEAKYKLKLSQKVSDEFYSHCDAFPVGGTGQGSSNSVAIWIFISSVLFEVHESEAFMMKMTTPNGNLTVQLNLVGFVDDTCSCTSGHPSISVADLLDRIQKDAQLWYELLFISGGNLELEKCGYHVIFYEYDKYDQPVMKRKVDGTVQIETKTGEKVTIKQKNIFQARKNLGHFKAPSRTYKRQTEAILQVADEIIDAIGKCGASRTMTKIFFDTVYLPSIQYTLPQSFLSDKQFQQIDSKVNKLLGKFGFSSLQATAITQAPVELGGSGCPPAYAIASTGYILHFLKNWRSPRELPGGTLHTVVSRYQQQSGISYPAFEHPHLSLPYVDGKVCQAIRRYLTDIKATIRIKPTHVPPPLRDKDYALMDRLLDLHVFTIRQQKQINSCRLFLGVTYLSEICNIRGTHLASGIGDGDTTNLQCTPLDDKIYQPFPNIQSWSLWDKFLQFFTIHPESTQLRHPLGNFHLNHSTRHRWKAYKNKSQAFIFDPTTSLWKQFEICRNHNIRPTKSPPIKLEHRHLTPISINMLSSPKISSIGTTTAATMKAQYIGPAEDWDTFILRKPAWIQHRLQNVHFFTPNGFFDPAMISDSMNKDGQLLLVSDGSLKHIHMMSFGWILSTLSGTWLAASSGPGSGCGTSLRIEADGMLSGAVFCGIIANEFVDKLHIKYICDNAELIRNLDDRITYNIPYPNTTLRPEFDLIEEIYQTNKHSRIQASYHWIKGHQDDLVLYDDLSIPARLNVEADRLAKEWNNDRGRCNTAPMSTLVPSNTAALVIEKEMITSDYRTRLLHAYTERRYMSYLQERFGWSDTTITTIAWKSFKSAIKNIDRPVVITKLTNRILAVNHILRIRKYREFDKCMHCDSPETVAHLYHCNHKNREQWRLKYISALRRKLSELKTDESLINAIASILTDFMDNGCVNPNEYDHRFHAAIYSQYAIGFDQWFLGKISQHWLNLFLRHLPPNPSLDRRYTWGRDIIELTLRHMIDLWELRNREVHGTTDAEIESIRKRRVTAEIEQYFALRSKCCLSDRDLFPDNPKEFIEKSTSQEMSDWILMNKGWIAASIERYEAGDLGNTPILSWLSQNNINPPDLIKKIKLLRRQDIFRLFERKEKEKLRKKREKEKGNTMSQSQRLSTWLGKLNSSTIIQRLKMNQEKRLRQAQEKRKQNKITKAKQKQQIDKNQSRIERHFTATTKTPQLTTHTTTKKHEHDPHNKERLRKNTTEQTKPEQIKTTALTITKEVKSTVQSWFSG